MTINVGEGKYTFFIFKGDYRIHCWRYNEPWMVFTKGHKAISSLMYDHKKLVEACNSAYSFMISVSNLDNNENLEWQENVTKELKQALEAEKL